MKTEQKSKLILKIYKDGEAIISVYDKKDGFTQDMALRAHEVIQLRELLNKKK